MKRFLIILMCILFVAPLIHLSGCSQGRFTDQRDIEQLLPVETMGFDREETGITVTLATGSILNNTAPLVLTGLASGIEPALIRLQDYSPKDDLYLDHVQYIIIGENMAENDITSVLDWVERSPFMRMDTLVFLAKDKAADTIVSASGEMTDISQQLHSLEQEAGARGQHIYTLLDIASGLADRSSALCLAVEPASSDGTVYSSRGSTAEKALLPAGYGVLKDGKLIAYLSQAETVGAMLFKQPPTGTEVEIEGTTLELLHGNASVSGQWSGEGTLTGLSVTSHIKAGILEHDPSENLDLDALNQAFADTAEQWLYDVVTRSQALSCDFLALEDMVLSERPKTGTTHDSLSWSDVFPSLPVTVQVKTEIQRGYDRTD